MLTADNNDADGETGCASGAFGSIIGEMMGKLKTHSLFNDMESLETVEAIDEFFLGLDELIQQGADLTKLSAAVSAFVFGLDPIIASEYANIAYVFNATSNIKEEVEFLKDNVQIDESEQERMNVSLNNVYEDYPELRALNVQVWPFKNPLGQVGFFLGGQVILVKTGMSDVSTQQTIFHEVLHVWEAKQTALGDPIIYGLLEAVKHRENPAGHDQWIYDVEIEYGKYLINTRMGEAAIKPSLDSRSW